MGIISFHDGIYQLVQQYVMRQRVAQQAMADLRPDLLTFATRSASVEQILQVARDAAHLPQQGTWGLNHEWQYTFHGSGCRLQHNVTSECIEWDAPDVDVFDAYWFINYCRWWISQPHQPNLDAQLLILNTMSDQEIEAAILATLQLLEQQGRLAQASSTNPNKMRLIRA